MVNESLLDRGRAALSAEDWVGACVAFEEYLQYNTVDAQCWFLLGAARHKQLKLSEAREAFLKVIELDPLHVQSRFALAVVCLELGDGQSASKVCQETTELFPENPEAWFSLGVSCEANGTNEAALESYDRALRLAPDHPGALKNRRAILLEMARFDEAIALCRSVVLRRPFSVEAQFGLGETLTTAQDFSEASKAFSRAAKLAPGDARVALHYGFALAQLEQFAEAQKQLDHAVSLDPFLVQDYRQSIFGKEQGDAARVPPRLDARALYLLRHFDQIERCNWKERERFVSRFADLIGESADSALTERALGFRALAMGLAPELQLKLARQIASGIEAMLNETATVAFYSPRPAGSNARIRIGYLSADFRYHPVALLLGDLFSWHDRARFEVVAYSIGEADDSEQRKTIIAGCDEFVNLVGMSDEAAAQRIAADSIHVLVDMAGYLDQSRPGILARRPAPVQVSWMGYLATTGSPWIDYVLADDVVLTGEVGRQLSEAQIRVPGGLWPNTCVDKPLAVLPDRREHGLPSEGVVLAAMHSHYKIDPQIFAVWMRLLAKNETAVLWMLDGHPEATAALRKAAVQGGISPERLIFAPKVHHDEHRVRIRLADLALDAPQCSGGTTTTDALVAGVPVLTCLGSTFMQRVAASLLHAAGQDHLIAKNIEQYEALAQEWLADPGRLRGLSQQIDQAKSSAPFFHPKEWLLKFEEGIRRAWEIHCADLPPQTIEVK